MHRAAAAFALIALAVAGCGTTTIKTVTESPTTSVSGTKTATVTVPSGGDVNKAWQKAHAGDTILLARGGSWNGIVLRAKAAGAPGVVIDAQGDKTGFISMYAVGHVEVRNAKTAGWQFHVGSHDGVMRDDNSTSTVFVSNSWRIQVLGGVIDGSGRYWNNGSQVNSTGPTAPAPHDVTFDHVTFRHFHKDPAGSAHVDCLHIWTGYNIIIRNSSFTDCETYTILFTTFNGPTPTGVQVYGNIFATSYRGFYTMGMAGGHGEAYTNYDVYNNDARGQSMVVCGSGKLCSAAPSVRIHDNKTPSIAGCINTHATCFNNGPQVNPRHVEPRIKAS